MIKARNDMSPARPSVDVYWDPAVYVHEMKSIFAHAWLFVGHDSMIPKNGDFVTNYMGDDPVILCRDKAGATKVYINRCRHRGNKVCLYDKGNARSFRCSYHGWTYDLDGALAGLPQLEAYGESFDRAQHGLASAARVASYRGLIFATWDEHAPSLEAYLGDDLRWYLDIFMLDDPEGLEVLPGRHRYIVPANWKLLAENFGGDMYHFASTHASIGILGRQGKGGRIRSSGDYYRGSTTESRYYSVECIDASHPPHGILQLALGPAARENDLNQAESISEASVAWVEERHRRRAKLLEAYEHKPSAIHTGNIWPNLSFNGFGSGVYARTFVQWHPRDAETTDVWQWAFVEKSAPPELKERMAFVLTQRQAAAGMVAPDDVDNFQRMHDVLHTTQARALDFSYDLGAYDAKSLLPDLPGHVMEPITEQYHRTFYRYWYSIMDREAC